MRKPSVGLLSLAAALMLAAAPAMAGSTKAKHHVSCKQIKEALASGKSAADVAAELKVPAARVKQCTKQTAKHHKTHQTTAVQ